MFDKFGEFNSHEELNRAAAGFKAEGDIQSLLELAEENGIDREDAQDYADDMTEEFSTVFSAAYGKLAAEKKGEIDLLSNQVEKMPLIVILTMLQGMCTDETVAAAVMKKGKRISEIFSAMRQEAEKHRAGTVGTSCGTDRELCDIIRSYYLEERSAFEKKIADLYA